MGETFTFTLKTVHMDAPEIIKKRGIDKGGRVQKFIDNEVLKLCEPYVPKDYGEIIRSGKRETVIGSGEVKYRTPYARRWYYIEAKFQGAPDRGTYWFERMKNKGGKEKILKGARKAAGTK